MDKENIVDTLIVFPEQIKNEVYSVTGMFSIKQESDSVINRYIVTYCPHWYKFESVTKNDIGCCDSYEAAQKYCKAMAKNILHGAEFELNALWVPVDVTDGADNCLRWITPLQTYIIFKFNVGGIDKYILNLGNHPVSKNSFEEAKHVAACDAYMRICTMLA